MWETTFPRNSHAGWGRPFYEQYILTSMKHVRNSRRQLTPVFDKPAFSRFPQNCEPLIVVEIFGKIVKRKVCQKRGWVAEGWTGIGRDVRHASCTFFWPRNTKPTLAHRPTDRNRSRCATRILYFYASQTKILENETAGRAHCGEQKSRTFAHRTKRVWKTSIRTRWTQQ